MESEAMKEQLAAPGGIAALEHLTGPSRGMVKWLSGPALDISLSSKQFIGVSTTHEGEQRENVVARLHRTEAGYEIEAVSDRPVWVNGRPISDHRLRHCDMIEFGDNGPLSRFRIYQENRSRRSNVFDVLSDATAYLRVSRRPLATRLFNAVAQVFRRLTRETTVLFRVSVIVSLAVLGGLAYQQYQVNLILRQQLEDSAAEFARALTNAREEALTPSDLEALRLEMGQQVVLHDERLAELERRSDASAQVIAQSVASVVFLQGAYGFRETSTDRMMRHVLGPNGQPLMLPTGRPLLSLDGDGPVAERQFTGTGFAVDDGTMLVTNRHVALPWENDANVEQLAAQGLEPEMIRFVVYLPGQTEAGEVELVRAADDADLALLRRDGGDISLNGLRLADTPPAQGNEVIVMGYPTGLRSMLAQAGEAFIRRLQAAGTAGFWDVAAQLAKEKRIAPLASRGIVSQVGTETVIYDAETTHGGSGGPVLNISGAVVAVNTAIMPSFGGSNLGVPADKVRALIEGADLGN